jgi:hypothetical protein
VKNGAKIKDILREDMALFLKIKTNKLNKKT